MRRGQEDALLIIRIVSDMAMVTIAWTLAYLIRFSGFFPTPRGIPDFTLYAKLIPFIWIIWFCVYSLLGFYRRTGHHRSAFLEGLDILQSAAVATLALIAFTYIYEEYRYSRVVMALFVSLQPWLTMLGRSLIRKAIRRYRRLAPPTKTLIIGSGEPLTTAIELAQIGQWSPHTLLGVMLVGEAEKCQESAVMCQSLGLSILPVPDNWTDYLSHSGATSVICAVPHRSYSFLDQHLEKLADQVTNIKIIPDLRRFTRFASAVEVVGGTPIIGINESPLHGMGQIIKRALDIGGAGLAILVFSPLMIGIAILVALTSRGPIFYQQERMGLDGKTFPMLKFRSMRTDAEQTTGAVWAKPDDDRTTPLGKWLRRTSLDELPQLFNVLKGDMSLVGPRPERPVFVAQFRRQIPGYYLRHKTKAGITGWAQVQGWRGNTSLEKRIECDLYYIQNWSVWFDLKILVLTVLRGFINKNAY